MRPRPDKPRFWSCYMILKGQALDRLLLIVPRPAQSFNPYHRIHPALRAGAGRRADGFCADTFRPLGSDTAPQRIHEIDDVFLGRRLRSWWPDYSSAFREEAQQARCGSDPPASMDRNLPDLVLIVSCASFIISAGSFLLGIWPGPSADQHDERNIMML
jgi:hypothetical protein